MRPTALIFALTITLSGCAASAAHDDPPAAAYTSSASQSPSESSAALQLAKTHWHFVQIDGKPVPPGVNATLGFGADGHVWGYAGCNSYGASWQSTGNGDLHFGAVLSTRMACLQPAGAMQTERGVFDVMDNTARARMDGGDLVLMDANGAKLATLQSNA